MSPLLDVLGGIFSSDGFVPRRICGLWPDWLIWEHVAGNAMIWLAYCAMPVFIWRLGNHRREWTPFGWIFKAFALFIGLCGFSHFLDMIAFFYPMYRLSGHILVMTGLVSWWMAWALRQAWPDIIASKSPVQLEKIIAERTEKLALANAHLRESEGKFHQLADAMPQIVWTAGPDGYLDYFNERWYEYTGMPRQAGIDRSRKPICHPDDVKKCAEVWYRAVEASEPYQIEYRLRDQKTGEYRWHLGRALPMKDEAGRVIRWFGTCTDIDDHKRAEEDRARLATIVDSSNDVIVGTDLDGIITSWNAGAERLFGYTAAEAVGQPITFLMPPAQQIEEAPIMERLRKGERVDHFDSVRIAKTGCLIDVSITISPIRDGADRIIGFSRIARDITDRKGAETQIRLLNESLKRRVQERTIELAAANDALLEGAVRFRAIFDAAFQLMGLLAPDGTTLEANQTALDFGGLTLDEVVGRPFWEARWWTLSAETQERLKQAIRDAAAGGFVRYEVDVRGAGDAIATIDFSLKPVLDESGQVALLIPEGRVITEQKRAAEALRLSEERFRGAFDSAATGVALVDPDGRWLQVNRSVCQIVGYSEEELLGMTWKEITHPDDLDPDLEQVRRLIGGEISSYQLEKRYIHKDGHVVWTILSCSLVRDADRKPLHCVAQIEDISTRKSFEEDLRRARDEAMAATTAKGEFLANMSHEIRTPMSGVIGMTELLLDTQLNDIQREYAQTIRSSGEALLTVINDILDFSKIEAGKLNLEVTELDLRTLMEEVADLLAPRAHQKRLELTCRIDPSVPDRLRGDPVRIRQVLTNLAGNAVKFTDRGEVNLEAQILDEGQDEATLRILVRDTGIGIPEDHQADVFESFTQIEGGNSRRHGGTGLGLTICRSLVVLMGGRIGVESTSGKGSTFWFELLLGKEPGGSDRPNSNLDGLHVLVIDDHETNRSIVRETLLSWACRPEIVSSGAEALARLLATPDDDPFGLVLLDHEMPGLDGEQTARAIKAAPRFTNVPLVLLTSLGSPQACEGSGAKLFFATLTKPVRRSQLYNTLCRAFANLGAAQGRSPIATADESKLSFPLRVLLAEDNAVNRKVAIVMVERLGCQVDAVENGREAVDRLDPSQHDLILMDVQMPEMDGFAATAAIRKREMGTGRHIPIVALTAHAMAGDNEKCLAAGMDGYLTKPIRPDPLREMLSAWSIEKRCSLNEPSADRSAGRRSFDCEALQESCGSDPDLIREVLRLMLNGTPARLQQLEAAIATEDSPRVAREAHGLKGAFLTVGAETLATACQELMTLSERGDIPTLVTVYRTIRTQWDRLKEEATRYLETPALPGK